jgi:hypothetical protein
MTQVVQEGWNEQAQATAGAGFRLLLLTNEL